eukprot:scaffold85757_cov26-Tisochrysis_lutea.AAC.2
MRQTTIYYYSSQNRLRGLRPGPPFCKWCEERGALPCSRPGAPSGLFYFSPSLLRSSAPPRCSVAVHSRKLKPAGHFVHIKEN